MVYIPVYISVISNRISCYCICCTYTNLLFVFCVYNRFWNQNRYCKNSSILWYQLHNKSCLSSCYKRLDCTKKLKCNISYRSAYCRWNENSVIVSLNRFNVVYFCTKNRKKGIGKCSILPVFKIDVWYYCHR